MGFMETCLMHLGNRGGAGMELIFDLISLRRCRLHNISPPNTAEEESEAGDPEPRGDAPDVPLVNPVTFKHIT